MVRAGVSSHGKTQVYLNEHGATTTGNYCIEDILETSVKYDIPHLFLIDIQRKMMLYQDSSPGHMAKNTSSFIKEHNINVIMAYE